MNGKLRRIGLGAVFPFFFSLSSPPMATVQMEEQQEILFENFSLQQLGEFPAGWRWRRNRDTGAGRDARRRQIDVFRWGIAEENGNRFLHIRDEHRPGHSVSVYL